MAFIASRVIKATVEQVFSAISDPSRFQKWWGPAGFTNTFTFFEFKKGGRWSLIMHGPDGRDYQNENIFEDIQAPRRIVVKHISEPKFTLTMELAPLAQGTEMRWVQEFDNEKVGKSLESIIVPSNAENLERLSVEVEG